MLSGNRSTRTSSGTAPQQRSRFSSPVGLGSRETFLAMPRWPQLTLITTRLARSRQAGSTLESSPDLPPTHSADQNAVSRNGHLPVQRARAMGGVVLQCGPIPVVTHAFKLSRKPVNRERLSASELPP